MAIWIQRWREIQECGGGDPMRRRSVAAQCACRTPHTRSSNVVQHACRRNVLLAGVTFIKEER